MQVQGARAIEAAKATKPEPGAGPGQLRLAQMNLWNLFDTVDDPKTQDDVLSPAQYETKLTKISNAIAQLGMPDLISVNEVENEAVLNDLISSDALKGAGYKVVMGPSNDGRGINVGILYKGDKLEHVGELAQPNPVMSFADRGRGQIDGSLLYARAPLVADFKLAGATQAADGANLLTVAVNHFKSKINRTGTDGPEKRREMQGQYLGEWLDARAKTRPTGATIVLGDLNANHGEPGYEKLAMRADGSKRFYDAPMKVDKASRYTYIYRGSKDLLDHVMVSAGKSDAIAGVKILHVNSAAPKSDKDDVTKLSGFSDHDPTIVDFDLKQLLG